MNDYYADILGYKRGEDVQPPKTKKYFRKTESGAGMTKVTCLDIEEKTLIKIKNCRNWKS